MSSRDSDHQSQTSTTSKSSSTLGRKGDPRMHRAVASRLEDPDLGLTDALILGGYQYAPGDDTGTVDSENVTLGQRKNQLSRRVRLARRKQQRQEIQDGSASSGGGDVAPISQQYMLHTQHSEGSSPLTNLSSCPNEYEAKLRRMITENFQQTFVQNQNQNQQNDGNQRCVESIPIQTSNFYPSGIEGVRSDANQTSALSTKAPPFPLSFLSAIGGDHVSNDSSSSTSFETTVPSGQHPLLAAAGNQSNCLPEGRSEVYTPPDPCDGYTAILGQVESMLRPTEKKFQPSTLPYQPGDQTQKVSHEAGFTSKASAMIQKPQPHTTDVRVTHNPVAVDSIARTAESVGMTLEQLAIVLQSNSHVRQTIAGESNNGSVEQSRFNQALAFCRYESKALYSKAMLLAGYPLSAVSDESHEYVQLAVAAWQQEGLDLQKRLQKKPSANQDRGDHGTRCSKPVDDGQASEMFDGGAFMRLCNNYWDDNVSESNKTAAAASVAAIQQQGQSVNRYDANCRKRHHAEPLPKEQQQQKHMAMVPSDRQEQCQQQQLLSSGGSSDFQDDMETMSAKNHSPSTMGDTFEHHQLQQLSNVLFHQPPDGEGTTTMTASMDFAATNVADEPSQKMLVMMANQEASIGWTNLTPNPIANLYDDDDGINDDDGKRISKYSKYQA